MKKRVRILQLFLVLSLILTGFLVTPTKADDTRLFAGINRFEESSPATIFHRNIRYKKNIEPLPEGVHLELEYYNKDDVMIRKDDYYTIDKEANTYNIKLTLDLWTDKITYVKVYSVDPSITEEIELGNSASQLMRIPVNFHAEGGKFSDGNSENLTVSYQGGKVYQADIYEEPTHEKYAFSHWVYLGGRWEDEQVHKTAINPNKVRDFYAAWEIPVHFETNGGSDMASIIVEGQNNYIPEPIEPTKNGSIFQGWYADKELTKKWEFYLDEVREERTLYAKWESETFEVKFETDGGSPVVPQTIEGGAKIIDPGSPTKDGYEFEGWYRDNGYQTRWDFNSDTVVEDTVLYAKWKRIDVYYTVTFDTQLNETPTTKSVLENTPVEKPIDPTRPGYKFDGWYTDTKGKNLWNFETVITEDKTLYAKWSVITHTIEFETNGGSNIKNVKVNEGKPVKEPKEPVKDGYKFDGWYGDDLLTIAWDFSTPITDSMTLYAKWERITYEVEFVTNGGKEIPSIHVGSGEIPLLPEPPIRDNYEFENWYKDEGLTEIWIDEPVYDNFKLYAKWNRVDVYYTVTFDYLYDNLIHTETVLEDTILTYPEEPVRDGYTFNGWTLDKVGSIPWDNKKPVNDNITLYAKWEKEVVYYTITFYPENGETVKVETVAEGTTVTKPTDPERNGYLFMGWYLDVENEVLWNFDEKVNQNQTLFAKWILLIEGEEKPSEEKPTEEKPTEEKPGEVKPIVEDSSGEISIPEKISTDKDKQGKLPTTGIANYGIYVGISYITLGVILIVLRFKIRKVWSHR